MDDQKSHPGQSSPYQSPEDGSSKTTEASRGDTDTNECSIAEASPRQSHTVSRKRHLEKHEAQSLQPVSRACKSCRERKIKCDREHPCRPCRVSFQGEPETRQCFPLPGSRPVPVSTIPNSIQTAFTQNPVARERSAFGLRSTSSL